MTLPFLVIPSEAKPNRGIFWPDDGAVDLSTPFHFARDDNILCDNITEKAAESGYTVIKQKERSYPLWQL